MASMEFKKGTREWCMFAEYWNLCKKFWIPEDNARYWDSVSKEASDFYKKYSDETFAKRLALAFIEELEVKRKTCGIEGSQGFGEKERYSFRICGLAKKYPFLGEAILNLIEELAESGKD